MRNLKKWYFWYGSLARYRNPSGPEWKRTSNSRLAFKTEPETLFQCEKTKKPKILGYCSLGVAGYRNPSGPEAKMDFKFLISVDNLARTTI